MRDGVHLNARLYRPSGSAQCPAIVNITPYAADLGHGKAPWYARRGYAYVIADSRGRGDSEGEAHFGASESEDCVDLIDWVSNQPWCNGEVVMRGNSRHGHNQWLAAKCRPEHLKTIVPGASTFPGVMWPTLGNVFYAELVQWLTLTSGRVPNWRLYQDRRFWNERYFEHYRRHQPFSRLDEIVGAPSSRFGEILKHESVDDWCDERSLTAEQAAQIDIPVLSITGQYDDSIAGTFAYYDLHTRYASEQARARHFLVVGPWDHWGVSQPRREVGGVVFGPESLVDLDSLYHEWYEHVLRDGPRPEFLADNFSYYVIGEESWRHASSVPAATARHQPLYLHVNGRNPDSVTDAGALLTEPQTAAGEDCFVYDPLDCRPGKLEIEPVTDFITDHSDHDNLYGRGVVYHTRRYDADLTVAGFFRVSLWLELDVPDTDFVVSVSEIRDDGTALRLSRQILRARYRESLREAKLLDAGVVYPFIFDRFPFVARKVLKGSRLRLVVACQNSIHFEKNYNDGGVVATSTGKDARTAHIKLRRGPATPSCIEVPIAAGQDPGT